MQNYRSDNRALSSFHVASLHFVPNQFNRPNPLTKLKKIVKFSLIFILRPSFSTSSMSKRNRVSSISSIGHSFTDDTLVIYGSNLGSCASVSCRTKSAFGQVQTWPPLFLRPLIIIKTYLTRIRTSFLRSVNNIVNYSSEIFCLGAMTAKCEVKGKLQTWLQLILIYQLINNLWLENCRARKIGN